MLKVLFIIIIDSFGFFFFIIIQASKSKNGKVKRLFQLPENEGIPIAIHFCSISGPNPNEFRHQT